MLLAKADELELLLLLVGAMVVVPLLFPLAVLGLLLLELLLLLLPLVLPPPLLVVPLVVRELPLMFVGGE
jgi:hypothetical protein